jgi:hypothetical protein
MDPKTTKLIEKTLKKNGKDLQKKLDDLPDYFTTAQIKAMLQLLMDDV